VTHRISEASFTIEPCVRERPYLYEAAYAFGVSPRTIAYCIKQIMTTGERRTWIEEVKRVAWGNGIEKMIGAFEGVYRVKQIDPSMQRPSVSRILQTERKGIA
jgi:hypothetical protein